MATDGFELSVDLDVPAEDMVIDDDSADRLKSNASKRKGRGFLANERDNEDFQKGRFDSHEGETTGNALRSVEGWIVLITNLHEESTEEDVRDKFADYGEIKGLHLNLDRRTGFVKGYALIEYDSYKSAKSAIDSVNGSEFLGRILGADFAFVHGAGGSMSVQHIGGGERRQNQREGNTERRR